jgi:hypothetical protein
MRYISGPVRVGVLDLKVKKPLPLVGGQGVLPREKNEIYILNGGVWTF